MRHRLYALSSLFHMLYQSICAGILFLFFEVILIKQEPHLLLLAFTCALFAASYLVREKMPNRLALLLAHAVLGASVFLLPLSMETKGLYCVIPCYLYVSSALTFTNHAYKRTTDDIPWPSFLLCVVVYLVGGYLGEVRLVTISYVGALLLLFLYLALIYIDGIESYLTSTKHVSGIPIRQILSTNTIIVGVIIACLILSLILGQIFDFKNILLLVGKAFLAVFTVIGRLVGLFFRFVSGWFSGSEEQTSEQQDFGDGDAAAQAGSMGEALEPVLYIGLACLLLFLLYKLVGMLVKWLLQKRSFAGDIVEAVEKKKEKRTEREKRRKFRLFLTAEERARYCYKQCMERYRYAVSLAPTKTGRELALELKQQELADVDALTEYYEKIRYGDKPVDREMLGTMRRLSGQVTAGSPHFDGNRRKMH